MTDDLKPIIMTVRERAHWLADKVPNVNDYTTEAMDMLRRLADTSDIRLQGIVRSSIHAYNAGKRWEEYEPGYTDHERMAWEIGRAEVEKVKRP